MLSGDEGGSDTMLMEVANFKILQYACLASRNVKGKCFTIFWYLIFFFNCDLFVQGCGVLSCFHIWTRDIFRIEYGWSLFWWNECCMYLNVSTIAWSTSTCNRAAAAANAPEYLLSHSCADDTEGLGEKCPQEVQSNCFGCCVPVCHRSGTSLGHLWTPVHVRK